MHTPRLAQGRGAIDSVSLMKTPKGNGSVEPATETFISFRHETTSTFLFFPFYSVSAVMVMAIPRPRKF